MIKNGYIVQLDPEKCRNPMFRGCYLTVTEIKDWGVQGYVQALGTDNEMGGQAFYRAQKDEYELVGRAAWVID